MLWDKNGVNIGSTELFGGCLLWSRDFNGENWGLSLSVWSMFQEARESKAWGFLDG